MLRALEPRDPRPPLAYRVPWRIDRSDAAHPRITNAGASAADFVRVFIASGRGAATTEMWGQVVPDEAIDLCLCAADADDVVVTIAWFRPVTGVEYVWRFVS